MGLIAEWIELQNKLENERCNFRKSLGRTKGQRSRKYKTKVRDTEDTIEALASEYQEIQKGKNKSGRGGNSWKINGENLL